MRRMAKGPMATIRSHCYRHIPTQYAVLPRSISTSSHLRRHQVTDWVRGFCSVPSRPMPLTRHGAIHGPFQYMAPERPDIAGKIGNPQPAYDTTTMRSRAWRTSRVR